MKKQELVYRALACRYIKGENRFTQLGLSKELEISLSMINNVISKLESINAVRVALRSFSIVSLERLLLFWSTHRSLSNDIVYSTRVDMPVKGVEGGMPDGVAFTAYTAYKLTYRDVPADYGEVYMYATEELLYEVKQRFRRVEGTPNLFVLKADYLLTKEMENRKLVHSSVCMAQAFVDLWNIRTWYAKAFVDALNKRFSELYGVLEQ